MKTLGIDASNIRQGGGVTHLAMLLKHAAPAACGFERVVAWAPDATLERLPECEWLDKRPLRSWGRGLVLRTAWQQWQLPRLLASENCRALFAPGGRIPRRCPVPAVTMSQNLLPFEPGEAERDSPFSWRRYKMRLLRASQCSSFRRADGVIFLTEYAKKSVTAALDRAPLRSIVIPHGVDNSFFCAPRPAFPPEHYDDTRPFRLLYVSIIDLYKHQWHVADAIGRLRQQQLPVSVDFAGPVYGPALPRFRHALDGLDPSRKFLRHIGPVPYDRLPETYRKADAFVFASSCENLPNILIEAMAAGLPIACSNRGPMPEVLGEAGLYFDPEGPAEIAAAVKRLFLEPRLREQLAQQAWRRAQAFDWARCAERTFRFIAETAK